eukprot:gnl/TRDRNA2_/TRDRNA2_84128_c2_seq1.p1 gnl/TRDRNA2_/TRDRNA2_84128_c2~~gnl/TRDRNA2_/TRDRNA2_84128_c2_seq1.p1  ORF type:complete len:851 (+),score=222.63 gnl/TRDRNA2_/TRDRNA2_84128_c2_seq1:73-2625(+)
MSSDIERLESAAALREWEERRAKTFGEWREAVQALTTSLRTTVGQSLVRHQQLELFLRHRSAAEKAYAQALQPMLAAPASEGEAVKRPPPKNLLLEALTELQRSIADARVAFASKVLEVEVLTSLTATASEFEKTSSRMLDGLDSSLVEVVEANSKAADAMMAFRASSIEGRRPRGGEGNLTPRGSQERPADVWLVEHRYRRAVDVVRERQRAFTNQLCAAIEEAWKLEVWREDMARKTMGRFCEGVFKVETSVQSLANDGVRALANNKKELGGVQVLGDLEVVLRTVPEGQAAAPAAAGDGRQVWPALQRLRALGLQSGLPPPSVLGLVAGPLQVPRQWYGSQLCIAVLTKDHWLHCFNVALPAAPPLTMAAGSAGTTEASVAVVGSRMQIIGAKASPSASPISSPGASPKGAGRSGDGVVTIQAPVASKGGGSAEFLEGAEVEPHWSVFVPNCSVAPTSGGSGGKLKGFEVEEQRKGFLGMLPPWRETLLADSEENAKHWIDALLLAQAQEREPQPTGAGMAAISGTSAASAAGYVPPQIGDGGVSPPPPPPPPPTTTTHPCAYCMTTPAPNNDLEQMVREKVEDVTSNSTNEIGNNTHEIGQEWVSQFSMIDPTLLAEEGKGHLVKVEEEEVARTRVKLQEETQRQKIALKDMEQKARDDAKANAAEVRKTSEEWAQSQAQNSIMEVGGMRLTNSSIMEAHTSMLRTQALDAAKASILAATHTLEIAKQAEEAARAVPRAAGNEAQQIAKEMQYKMELQMNQTGRMKSMVELISEVITESAEHTKSAMTRALQAKADAETALATAKKNNENLSAMKARMADVIKQATQAKEMAEEAQNMAESAPPPA